MPYNREYYLKNKEKLTQMTVEWFRQNRERWNAYQRRRWKNMRTTCITTTSGRIYGSKRPYPENGCELCNRIKKLHYHHYDNENLMKGFWVCNFCHIFVERLESVEGILDKYAQLRKMVFD